MDALRCETQGPTDTGCETVWYRRETGRQTEKTNLGRIGKIDLLTHRRRRQMQTTHPKMKPTVSIIIIIMAVFCCQAAAAGAAQPISTDKNTYNRGETIRVNFSDSPGNDSDWICLVPAGSPDTEAGDYQYMPKGLNQGVLTFASPAPGKYEVRAYYHYKRNGYVVTARYGFSVADSVPPVESKMASPARPSTPAEKTTTPEKSAITAISRGATR
jgi:hypothetical protein